MNGVPSLHKDKGFPLSRNPRLHKSIDCHESRTRKLDDDDDAAFWVLGGKGRTESPGRQPFLLGI